MYHFFAHGSWWFVLDLAKSIYIKIRPYNILLLILRDLKIKYSPDYIIIVLYKTFLLFHIYIKCLSSSLKTRAKYI